MSGFMTARGGHWNDALNSLELLRVAWTLVLLGGWGLVNILLISYSSELSLHQTWA